MNKLLTETAKQNYEAISTEANQVEIFSDRSERDIVGQYLSDLQKSNDLKLLELLRIIDTQINQLPTWREMPELVVTIPVVGTGNQETQSIRRFFEEITEDISVLDRNVRFVFLVNRPDGSPSDFSIESIRTNSRKWGIGVDILDIDIPDGIGRLNEEIPEMAESDDQPVIGVIRNLLDVIAMRLAVRTYGVAYGEVLPIMLQMDVDFEGFGRGGFNKIIENFKSYPEMQFLQCTSDWDSKKNPTSSDSLLKLGSDLMRMLPLAVKANLNKAEDQLKAETIFGEVIQRGIQVPQAQRMSAVALGKSYGMLRFTADELDFNIRSAAVVFGENAIRSTANTVFQWSNRRALRAWKEYGRPPISQWSAETPFSINDPVRNNRSDSMKVERSEIDVINLTLKRMPIPVEWSEEYRRKFEMIISRLANRPIRLEVSDPDINGRVFYSVNLEN